MNEILTSRKLRVTPKREKQADTTGLSRLLDQLCRQGWKGRETRARIQRG